MPDTNIVLIHTHDTGRYVQPYGHPVSTPRLQRFAEEAWVWRQAFCGGPTCSPSRAAMLLGQAPHSTGMLGLAGFNGWTVRDMDQHILYTLRDAGYLTALAGVQHIADDDRKIGYDAYLTHGKDNPQTSRTPEYVRDFLQQPHTRPFFLNVGLWETHRHKPYPEIGPDNDPRWTRPAPYLPDDPQTRHDMARFNGAVQEADEKIGRVLDALEETGHSERSLVIITTDHGIGHPGMKANLTDGGLGVMLMMRGPGGFSGGRVSDALVSHIDLFPTLCDYLDIDPPSWLQGRSLMPIVRGDAKAVNDQVFGELTWHCSYDPQRCVRTNRYKLVRRFDGRSRRVLPNTDDGPGKDFLLANGWAEMPMPAEALYDLYQDPLETNNLISINTNINDPQTTRIAEDLRNRLDRWMRDTADPLLLGPVPPPSPGHIIDVDAVSCRAGWIET